MFRILFFLLLGLSFKLQAQLPATDLWLVNITKDTVADKLIFSQPVKIKTGKVYNNQPSFTPDGLSLLFASSTDTAQTDIYSFTFKDSSLQQITETPESEFSPVMYEKDRISVVRKETDKAQRLYALYKEDDYRDAHLLVNFNDSVAYYGWINKDNVALCVLNGKKTELHLFTISSQQYVQQMTEKTGRCFGRFTDGEICYVIKETDTTGMIIRYDFNNEMFTELCPLLTGSEDFALTPDGNVWMGRNGRLFSYNYKDSKWNELADFSKITGPFYRLTVSPDGRRLALVSYSGKKP